MLWADGGLLPSLIEARKRMGTAQRSGAEGFKDVCSRPEADVLLITSQDPPYSFTAPVNPDT